MPPPIEFPPQAQRYAEQRFCPRCGMMYREGDFKAAEALFMCAACGLDDYQNPAPAAVVAIPHPRDPALLLMLKRSTPPHIGRWCVPGGFIRYGEDPPAAAAREVREEVGLEARIGRVLRAGLVDYRYKGRQICVVEISFVGHVADVPALASLTTAEASEIAFYRVTDILAQPELLAFPEQLEVVRAYHALAAERPVEPVSRA